MQRWLKVNLGLHFVVDNFLLFFFLANSFQNNGEQQKSALGRLEKA